MANKIIQLLNKLIPAKRPKPALQGSTKSGHLFGARFQKCHTSNYAVVANLPQHTWLLTLSLP